MTYSVNHVLDKCVLYARAMPEQLKNAINTKSSLLETEMVRKTIIQLKRRMYAL